MSLWKLKSVTIGKHHRLVMVGKRHRLVRKKREEIRKKMEGVGGRGITHRLLHSYCDLAFAFLSYLAVSYLFSPQLISAHDAINR